jgi:circadian clock protein KaiB
MYGESAEHRGHMSRPKRNSGGSSAERLAAAIEARDNARYVLRLYVTGSTPHSIRAIVNIRKICEEYLKGHYDLEVVDISQRPNLAEGEQIIAAPTLIKKLPLPIRRFIGDMSHREKLIVGLDLRSAGERAVVGL